ncbi:MAG: hypothetical protein KC766_21620, partial [Myxococcales bacterium]|nr:hypothetical protein [Myxococcales bacterium]
VAKGIGIELPEAPRCRVKPQSLPESPPLGLIEKGEPTLDGRVVGILCDDGSSRRLVTHLRKAIEAEGARTLLVAPRVQGLRWDGRGVFDADGQIAGTPSANFDAVALVLSEESGERLAQDAATVDFVRDAFGHLKTIGFTDGATALLEAAGIEPDHGIIPLDELDLFIDWAKTRVWEREHEVRMLA